MREPLNIPDTDANRDTWVYWFAEHLTRTWPTAIVRASVEGYKAPGVRRGVLPDVEFWYPNEAGVHQLLHLYQLVPTPFLNERDVQGDLRDLLAYCRTNGRQLTLVVPDRALTREELEELDAALGATLSPMLFEVAAYTVE